MTFPNHTHGLPHQFAALALLLLAVGCNQLAPGISPIANDEPLVSKFDEATDQATETPTAEDVIAAELAQARQASTASPSAQPTVAQQAIYTADAEGIRLQDDGLIYVPSDAKGERHVARQFPQAPAGGGYLPPPAYQPPSIPAVPQSTPPATNYIPPPAGTLPSPQGYAAPPAGMSTPLPMAPSDPNSLPPPANAAPDYGSPSYPTPVPSEPPNSPAGTPLNPYYGAPSAPPVYTPNTQYADLELTGVPARTGRIMVGGSVNSDAGVMGQITLDERNFDITRWPTSFQDLASGTAFRGAGQSFRIEAVPGSEFQRYMVNFSEPNLFGFMPISLGLSGFLYDRRYQDWNEQRVGGRIALGYRVNPELSLTAGITGQNVKVTDPRVNTVDDLNSVLGDNELFTPEFKLTHDNRDSPFQPTEGHFFEFSYEPNFGDYDFGRFDIENRNYLLVAQRADGSGKQTLSLATRLGFSGEETPIFENYFAGGYSTMRGFDFRGANPVEDGVQVGGRFQWLNTLEYMFPITADDAFRGVAFVDFGTVERDIELNEENFRVAPGLGLRVAIPMLGPAPLAFDFAYPVTQADTDERRIFSFYMSALR